MGATSIPAQSPDQPWTQADRSVWVAALGGVGMTVTQLTDGGFVALVDDPTGPIESPVLMTLKGAQTWAESRAGR
jgi:hypothetical protein